MRIPDEARRRNGFLITTIVAGAMVLLGAYGVLRDDLVIPGLLRSTVEKRHMRVEYLHFSGIAAWAIFAALTAIAAGMIIGVYKRANRVKGAPRNETLEASLLIVGLLVLVAMVVAKYIGYV